LILSYGNAQTNKINTNPTITNTSSGSYKSDILVIDWNLGEVLGASLTKDQKLILTTGFLQSSAQQKIIVPATDSLLSIDRDSSILSIYPNPTKDHVYIKNIHPLFKIVEMYLYDINGHLIKLIGEPYSTTFFDQKIILTNISSGTYILVAKYIINQKYYRAKIFKIIKA
jgi:hypothetical protein